LPTARLGFPAPFPADGALLLSGGRSGAWPGCREAGPAPGPGAPPWRPGPAAREAVPGLALL